MSTLTKVLTLLVVFLGIGAGLVLWETTIATKHGEANEITREEMEILLRDFNPMQRKNLAERPEERERLIKNLKEVLAISSEARKYGIAKQDVIKEELDNIERAILAISYDQKVNKDKGPMPPFGFVSEDEIKAFWDEDKPAGTISWIWQQANGRWHESEFDKFLETKIALAVKRGQLQPGQEPNEKDIAQARDSFARTWITYYKAKNKLRSIDTMTDPAEKKEWQEFKTRVDVQTRLQKAQLLSTFYVQDVLSKELKVSDKEVEEYIAAHPELSKDSEKLAAAKEVLAKVKAGGDFAELAKEYSDDPGSKARGGLYEGVLEGQFDAEFEAAVSKLKPGEITQDLVKTPFGYHVIKLEKRGSAKGNDGTPKPTYDVRHILISTMIKDPENPAAREVPLKQFVKAKLEKEKQEEKLREIMEKNPVSIAADFEVPEISAEELEKMGGQRPQGVPQAPNAAGQPKK